MKDNTQMRRLHQHRPLMGLGLAAVGALTALSTAAAAGSIGAATPPKPPGGTGSSSLKDVPAPGQLTIKPAGPKLAPAIKSSQLPGPTGGTSKVNKPNVKAAVTVRSIDLWARAGSIPTTSTGAPAPIPIWSFTLGAADPVVLPGVTLVANQGEDVQLTLHNALPAADGNVGLDIPGAAQAPDLTGAAPGGAPVTTTFSGLAPGTYIYQASGTGQGPRQVAMGLSGILIVRPASFLAPLDALATDLGAKTGTMFTAEAAVEVQEIDPTFNASPLTSDLSQYHPQYFLINGQAFGGANPVTINVNPTDKLLLRYADLGLTDHELSLVGERQTVVAQDGHAVTNQVENNVEFLTAGQTQDTITAINPHKFQGDSIALVDLGRRVYNSNAGPNLGGMVALVNLVNAPLGVPAGPTTQVDLTPHVLDGAASSTQRDLNLSVTATFNQPVTGVKCYVDFISGTGHDACQSTPLQTPTSSTFTIDPNDLIGAIVANLPLGGPPINGDHVIWVQGGNAAGYGAPSGDVVTVSMKDPQILGMQLHMPRTNTNPTTALIQNGDTWRAPLPNKIDSSNDVVVIATAAATLNDWVITDARYCVDLPANATTCPAGNVQGTLTVNPKVTPPATATGNAALVPCNDTVNAPSGGPDSPTTVCGTIKAADLEHLGEGPHTVTIQARQAMSTTSNAATTTYTTNGDNKGTATDTTAAFLPDYFSNEPVSSGTSTGTIDHNTATTLTLTGPWTGVAPAQPADGTAFTILSNGRWGAYSQPSTLTIDRQGPVVDTVANPGANPPILAPSVAPNPNNGFQNSAGNVGFLDSVQVQATFDDTTRGSSPIVLAEAFLGSKVSPANTCTGQPATTAFDTGAEMVPHGGLWSVSPVQTAYAQLPLADIRTCAEGTVAFFVHAKDAAGNWGPFHEIDLTLDKTAPAIQSATASGNAANTRTLTVQASDNTGGTGINAAEAFIGADPGLGNGKALPGAASPSFTASVSWGPSPVAGTVYLGTTAPVNSDPSRQLWVRVRDAAGNWSQPVKVTV